MKRITINLKEGRHFEVDRAQGVVRFKTPPMKGARTSIGYTMQGSVRASMSLTVFQAMRFWLAEASMRVRSVVARRNASSATH